MQGTSGFLVLLFLAETSGFCPTSARVSLLSSVGVASCTSNSASLTPPRRLFRPATPLNTCAQLEVVSAGNELRQAQAGTLDLLVRDLGLQQEDAPFSLPLSDGLQGTVQSWTGGDVSWCSTLDIVGTAFSQSKLTVWNGPLVGVPHFRSSITLAPDSVRLLIDFCPRGDAGYEQVLPDGSFQEPDSRAMFMQRSMRTEFEELFFTEEARGWFARASSGGAPAVPRQLCEGPLKLDVTLPPTPASVAHATAACAEAARLYGGWMGAAERFGQVKSQLAFAHDCKVRAMISSAHTAELVSMFGPAGRELAAAHGGPRDITDRGSAMSNAAKDNLGAGEAGNA